MNQEQKEHILVLRSKGVSFGKIAKEMGLSINTIKSFCYRNPIAVSTVQPEQKPVEGSCCLWCNRILNQSPGHRQKKFCSDACRYAWWAAHPEQAKKKAWHGAKCRYCRKNFSYYGNQVRKYCSLICYREHRHKMGGVIHV